MLIFTPAHQSAVPASANMSDLTKILTAALLGMFTGIVATVVGERVKEYVGFRIKRKRIHVALVNELHNLKSQLLFIKYLDSGDNADRERSNQREIFRDLKTEVFDYYYEKEREVLFSLTEWEKIEPQIRYFKRAQRRYIEQGSDFGDAVTSGDNIITVALESLGFHPMSFSEYRKAIATKQKSTSP